MSLGLIYEEYDYNSCHDYELPSELKIDPYNNTTTNIREATKADFIRLFKLVQKITEENFRLFSGELTPPDVEPGDRLITLGQL